MNTFRTLDLKKLMGGDNLLYKNILWKEWQFFSRKELDIVMIPKSATRRDPMVQAQLPIFPADLTPINNLIGFRSVKGTVFYLHDHLPLFQHGEDDQVQVRVPQDFYHE